tara:strand:+ start:91 stop:699 length:609 start_codon:yes stop_codon:yes gene_type:complete
MKEKKSEIIPIFSTPIFIADYGRVDKELELIKKMSFRSQKFGNGNQATKNSYILNEIEFGHLKRFILENLKTYAKTVLETSEELYITQSWTNRNKKGMVHHEHIHPNSIVSGVLFLNKEEKFPPIKFSKNVFNSIQLKINKFNSFNSTNFSVGVKPGKLILFPSSLRHSVPVNICEEERYTLSFNTFAKTLGAENNLTLVKQ